MPPWSRPWRPRRRHKGLRSQARALDRATCRAACAVAVVLQLPCLHSQAVDGGGGTTYAQSCEFDALSMMRVEARGWGDGHVADCFA